MNCTVKSLSSTQRIVEWEELPPSVRSIPTTLNPLADGVLMKHQKECAALQAAIKLIEKGRRTGITFATALEKTLVAAASKQAGGDNVYYIGDTKEKGLEYIGYTAHFSRVIAEAQGQGVSSIEEFLFEDQDEQGNTKYITSYRIRYSSGFQVAALSSRPANIRGLQGHVVIDEAAFHADVHGVLEAATALLIWEGCITIISTHNGKNNPFNQLKNDIEAGRHGKNCIVYRATFDDAVANGLYERVCLMNNKTPTPEGKEEWYTTVRESYGSRKAAMLEELDCIPRDGGGVSIPSILIENSMREVRPVLRLQLDDAFYNKSENWRISWGRDWIEENLTPILATLNPAQRHVLGQDYARHRDFSVIVPLAVDDTLNRICPFMVDMHKVPSRQQEQIVWTIIESMPRFSGAAFDARGNGAMLAEYTADRFGQDYIYQVMATRKWYGEIMPKLKQGFEDGIFDLPRDENLLQDLRMIVDVDGIPMIPELTLKDLKDADLKRHGDGAIALALALFASYNMNVIPFESQSIGKRTSATDSYTGATTGFTSSGFGSAKGNLDFRGFNK